MNWHRSGHSPSISQSDLPTRAEIDSDRTNSTGLSQAEANSRLLRFGPNSIEEERPHILKQLVGKLVGPVPFLLEAAIVLEIAAGKQTEALIVAVLVVFNGVLSFLQEGRARQALSLLRSRLAVQARVIRDGHWGLIEAERLVPGDVVHVRAGDIAPADIVVQRGDVAVDQSALTGESRAADVHTGDTLYAGSILLHGEATGEVHATGAQTYFGRTAELMRSAKTASHLERTIFRVVWALLAMDGAIVVAILAYGLVTNMAAKELLPFVLILVIATVPVALPATFTLATSLGALELARSGVLVTHLSAIEEAAAMDLLCTDKTGTITENRLSVTAVTPYDGSDEERVLALAAAASDEATQDPIDLAILTRARDLDIAEIGQRLAFVPFDPQTKRSEAQVEVEGTQLRVLKGSPAVVTSLVANQPDLTMQIKHIASSGARVLAVAAGTEGLALIGLVALGDPIRPDSAALVERVRRLGVRVIMVSGDAPDTTLAVAHDVGLGSRLGSAQALHDRHGAALDFDVVAGVLPEDKLALVEQAQRAGHVVGMTGDGVNDAPALKRAEVGIAVSSATDVAKDAASIVLTTAGLGEVVSAIEMGRRVYQRMLTYTLNKIAKTFQVSLFLGLGLIITGSFVTTPRLVLLLLFANDFVTMAIATDRVGFSAQPDRWQVRTISLAALGVALPWLGASFATFYIARDVLGLGLVSTQTLVFVMLVFTGQATVYLVRERGHLWKSRASAWLLAASVLDVVVVTTLANRGVLMAPIPLIDIAVVLGAVVAMTIVLDACKAPLLSRLQRPALEHEEQLVDRVRP